MFRNYYYKKGGEMMYAVRFTRKDERPCEQYFYQQYKDALAHMKMYANGNLDTYLEIALIFIEKSGKEIKVIALN